jgi:DNA-binding transcriptional LysR family regulator
MCHMIAAGLGVGVAPLGACRAQAASLDLKTLRLTDAWAQRRLLLASRAGAQLAPAAVMLLEHLRRRSG